MAATLRPIICSFSRFATVRKFNRNFCSRCNIICAVNRQNSCKSGLFLDTFYSSNVLHASPSRFLHTSPSHGIKAADLISKSNLTKDDIGCPICSRNITFTYKDVLFLAQFLSPEGHLLNRRHTGVCKKQQLKLGKAIKISRRLDLLPKCGPVEQAQ